MKIKMECTICYERKGVCSCPSCSEKFCLECVKRWIISETRANCMNCRAEWSYGFLTEILPKKFIQNEFKKSTKEKLGKEEDDAFPAVKQSRVFQTCLLYLETADVRFNIPFVSLDVARKIYVMHSDDILILRRVAPWLYYKIDDLVITDHRFELKATTDEQVELLRKIIHKQIREYMPRINMIDSLPHNRSLNAINSSYKINCPNSECKGIVIADHCIDCLQKVCNRCWEAWEHGHHCDPGKVDNVESIKKDSQNCPSCLSRVHKINGCNHITCTICNTHFDYITGEKYLLTNEGFLTENEMNSGRSTNLIRNRERIDNTFRLKLRIFYHLGLIDHERFINLNHYFWRVTQLEREELHILHEMNNKVNDEEEMKLYYDKLEKLAHKYDLTPIKKTGIDPYLRRHSAPRVDRKIEEIIERFM